MENDVRLNCYLPAAAAVLEFGDAEQSPIAKTLLYFTCCMVLLSTSTNPASFTKSLHLDNSSGVLMGGTTWSMEN